MIGYLKGEIIRFQEGKITLKLDSIGYIVNTSKSFMLGSHLGDIVELFIYTDVKENGINLYGFSDTQSLDLFHKFIGISGIGPKTALSILDSGFNPVIKALNSGNLAFFQSIPRLGRKNAQKILIELKNLDLKHINNEKSSQLIEALMSLGFDSDSITKVISQVDENSEIKVQIKEALKLLKNPKI